MLLDWMSRRPAAPTICPTINREIPAEVKPIADSARDGKAGRHMETIARAAEAAVHRQTACELYYRACEQYRIGQHAIFVTIIRTRSSARH